METLERHAKLSQVKVGRREFSACIDGWMFIRKRKSTSRCSTEGATSSASTGAGRVDVLRGRDGARRDGLY